MRRTSKSAGADVCLGDEEFRQELLARGKAAGASHYGGERRERDEARARCLIAEPLARLRWQPADLALHRQGDANKVSLAARLRRETTMSLKWIASELHMGSWTYVSNLLAQRNKV